MSKTIAMLWDTVTIIKEAKKSVTNEVHKDEYCTQKLLTLVHRQMKLANVTQHIERYQLSED